MINSTHYDELMRCLEYLIARGDRQQTLLDMLNGWFPETDNDWNKANPIWLPENIEFAKLVYNHVDKDFADTMYMFTEDEELSVLLRLYWRFDYIPWGRGEIQSA